VVASRLAKGLRDGGGSPPYRLPRPPPFRPIFQPITQSSFPHPHPPVIQHAGIAFSESRQTEGRRLHSQTVRLAWLPVHMKLAHSN